MKQSKLGFSSSKRTASSGVIGKPKTTPKPAQPPVESPPPTARDKLSEDEIQSFDDKVNDSSDSIESSKEEKVEMPSTGPSTTMSAVKTTASKKKTKGTQEPSSNAANSLFRPSNAKDEDVAKKVEANMSENDEAELPNPAVVKRLEANVSKKDGAVLPELKPNNPKYREHYNEIKKKRGGLPTIHLGDETKIHEILRGFDNTYEYGPCVGVSRRDRWDRAQALGLNPPKEVDDILKTRQGKTMIEYSQSVFYGQV